MKTIKLTLVMLLLFLMLTIKIVVLCSFLVLKGLSQIPFKAMEVFAKVDERVNNYMMNLYKKHVGRCEEGN